MATANVIAFSRPQSKPQPEIVGNIFNEAARLLITAQAGKTVAAVRINIEGFVTLVAPECDFYPEAIAAPGFAGFCIPDSDPDAVAGRLHKAHSDVLAWMNLPETYSGS